MYENVFNYANQLRAPKLPSLTQQQPMQGNDFDINSVFDQLDEMKSIYDQMRGSQEPTDDFGMMNSQPVSSGAHIPGTVDQSLMAFLRAVGGQKTSGYRSNERQAALFANALKKYGSEKAARKWVAPPGKSKHNIWANGGSGAYDTKINLGKYPNIDEIGKQYGFYRPMSWENWHWQPIPGRFGNGG